MAKTVREQLREEMKQPHEETKAYITAYYGSIGNFVLCGAVSVLKWIVIIFAAFIAAILNLARKS